MTAPFAPVDPAHFEAWAAPMQAFVKPWPLDRPAADAPGTVVDKVGILPVWRDAEARVHVRLAKPHRKKPELGDPGFQLPKGTRKFCNPEGEYVDIGRHGHRVEDIGTDVLLESLLAGAMREAHEEVGLRPDNVETLWDLGSVRVPSISSGTPRIVHMYVARIRHPERFDAPDHAHASAENVRWFELVESPRAGEEAYPAIHPNHRAFLHRLAESLLPELRRMHMPDTKKTGQ